MKDIGGVITMGSAEIMLRLMEDAEAEYPPVFDEVDEHSYASQFDDSLTESTLRNEVKYKNLWLGYYSFWYKLGPQPWQINFRCINIKIDISLFDCMWRYDSI